MEQKTGIYKKCWHTFLHALAVAKSDFLDEINAFTKN